MVRLRRPSVAAGLLIATYIGVFGRLTWAQHENFGTFGYDMGLYDQGIWLLSRFQDPFVTIRGLHGDLKPRQKMMAEIVASDGGLKRVPLICRIDTLDELDYFKNGGILQYVLRHLAA